MQLLDAIIAYETDGLTAEETLELFSGLIQTGLAWTLQGSYGRAAHDLIEAGLLTVTGEITERGREAVAA